MRGVSWFACAALVAAGCGSGDDSGAPSAPAQSATATATTAAAPVTTMAPAATTTEPVPMALVAGEAWIVYMGPFYERDEGVGNRLVRPDGTDDHWSTPQVPARPRGGWQVGPDWSPDGSRLVFAVDDADDASGPAEFFTRDLWVSQPDGTAAERILNCVLPCLEADDPAWSPDGKSLAFVQYTAVDEVPVSSLRTMDLDTGAVTTLATATGADAYVGPRWSPDGQRIVMAIFGWSDATIDATLDDTVLAVVDLADSQPVPRVMTEAPPWANYPDWHPTEDLVVFSTRPWDLLAQGPSNLYTIRPDGSALTQLTEFDAGETRAVQPTWTPDGERIIFTAVEGDGFGNPTMAIVDRDGTGFRPATESGPMFGTHPRLRPS